MQFSRGETVMDGNAATIEITAKHKGMNEHASSKDVMPNGGSQLTRVTRLLRRAQDSLHSELGPSPTYANLEEFTGVPAQTIKDWLNNKGRPTAEFLLQLLEGIPDRQRHELLDSACRTHATLEHPRLKCDQTIISRLKSMVCLPRGLVYVQNGTDETRTFIVNAMANAFLGLKGRPRCVAGLDAHKPDWFVPLPGVKYFANLFQPGKQLEAARENWPKVQARGWNLVVLNGMGIVAMPDFQRRIKELTGSCPLMIAEAAHVKPSLLKRASQGPVYIVSVSRHPDNAKGIAVDIEAT
jgi:hypothetical protein